LSEGRVRIDRRFHGPPDSGNGGYVAGVVSGVLGGPACTVTLHRPPPLDLPLELRTTEQSAELLDGDQLIASAVSAELDLEVPAPPAIADAQAAQARFVGHHRHYFPSCFVCGPRRAAGDGLAIYPGILGGEVAATWTPGADLAAADGSVRREFLWAALDCPGYWAVEQAAGRALLGRMTARIERPAPVGEPLIVTGWAIASEGRKHQVGTAVHDRRGGLVACARSTWITVA
jgi:hypothetical protein